MVDSPDPPPPHDPLQDPPRNPPGCNRRTALAVGCASVVELLGAGCALAATAAQPSEPSAGSVASLPAFESLPPTAADTVVVPPGYQAQVLYRWGDAVGLPGLLPPWRDDTRNSAAEQAQQAGMHHDGMHFFALDDAGKSAAGRPDAATHGLLVLNHEYTDEALLHAEGADPPSLEKVRKSQHAMGVSVVEVRRLPEGPWHVVRPSRYARRLHANSPLLLSGPAAGHPLLRTAHDGSGTRVTGTLANCAMGVTPWGTYLSCEENFHGYFGGPASAAAQAQASARQRRYGLRPGSEWVPWWRLDERFDLTRHPNEAHRFGWVVEIDPFDPTATPVKRTALGRKCQESATCTLTRDGRVAVYMGDDGAFEFIYKFVSWGAVRPGGAAANRDLLDHGTLYAARFDANGQGHWLPLVAGSGGLQASQGFASQAEVCVFSRLAATTVGATPMDRPEWMAVHPQTGEVFAALTGNRMRGAPGYPAADAANPRAPNPLGHVLRWREEGDDAGASRFAWNIFLQPSLPAGTASRPLAFTGEQADAWGAPDGLHFDSDGLLWIQTDVSNNLLTTGAYAAWGNNQLLCANVATGRIRRFLTGPLGCEITGCVLTPDRRTLFVNIQHPGESGDGRGPISHWPDGGSQRPRSATVAVWRTDGGRVGS